MSNLQQLSFDYSTLDYNTATLAKEAAIEIKYRERVIYENIIEIGNKLIAVKAALPHGKFLEWIEMEFQWKQQTANNFMKIAKEIPNSHYSGNLPNSMKALYALASGLAKADEEIKQEIVQEVKEKTEAKGKPLTEKEIKEITKEYELKIKTLENQNKQIQLKLEGLKDEEQKKRDLLKLEIEKEKQEIALKLVQEQQRSEDKINELQEQLIVISDLKTQLELEKTALESEIEKAIESKWKEETEELETYKKGLQKSVGELQSQHGQLTSKIENLEKQKQALLPHLDMAKKQKAIKTILGQFEAIAKTVTNEQQYLISECPVEMVSELRVIVQQFRFWADVIDNAIAPLEHFDTTIIEATLSP